MPYCKVTSHTAYFMSISSVHPQLSLEKRVYAWSEVYMSYAHLHVLDDFCVPTSFIHLIPAIFVHACAAAQRAQTLADMSR